MAKLDPGELYSPEPNILERKAARYLAGSSEGAGFDAGQPGEAEAAEITSATRRAVILAAAAGIVSGGLIGGSEVWIRQGIFNGTEDVGWREQLPYWIGFFAFAGVVSAIEIAYLYYVALRGIGRVASRAGLALGDSGYPDMFARGLARGGLEFPNPRVQVFGIDPYAYVPRWKLAAKNIAYKMKVGVSSFLLRVFLRRVAARVAVRGIVPLVAGPLYAAWNAIIVWRIMHEARLRTLGPFAVETVVREMFDEADRPGDDAIAVMLQGTGEMLKRGSDAHPNSVYLLSRLREALGHDAEIEVDWDEQRAALRSLEPAEQEHALAVLTLAALVGSRVRRAQRDMLADAADACGRPFRAKALKRLRADLKAGRRIALDDLHGVFHDAPDD